MNSAVASRPDSTPVRPLPAMPMPKPLPSRGNRLIAATVVAGHALLLAWLPTGAISPASGSTPAALIASWIDASASSASEKADKAQPPAPLPAPAPKAPSRTQSATTKAAADTPATLLTSTAAPTSSAASAASTSLSTTAATPVADGAAGNLQPTANTAAAAGDAGPAGRISPPRFDADYLKNPAPAYPRSSRERGEAGLVVLRVLVSRDGLPLEIDLQRSSGFERLDDAALAAVRHWQFLPARQGGEAISARVLVPISFNLRS